MPQLNVNISRFYNPVHKLRWTWQENSEMHTKGYSTGQVKTEYGIDGRPEVKGKVESKVETQKKVNSYTVTVRYEGSEKIGDANLVQGDVTNFATDPNIINEARRRSGIKGDGNYLSCGQCLCVSFCCLTIVCCGLARIAAQGMREGRKKRLQDMIETVANEHFEKRVAELVKDADTIVNERIAKLRASQIPASGISTSNNLGALTPEQYQLLIQLQKLQQVQLPNAGVSAAPLASANSGQYNVVVPAASNQMVQSPQPMQNMPMYQSTSMGMSPSAQPGYNGGYATPQFHQFSQEGRPAAQYNAATMNTNAGTMPQSKAQM